MDKDVEDLLKEVILKVASSPTSVKKEVAEGVAVNGLADCNSIWNESTTVEIDFDTLEYRKAPSLASASSVTGNEVEELSDSDLPFFGSDEDSDAEFERLQKYTFESRLKTFLHDHPSGVPEEKKHKLDVRLNTDDICHEYDCLPFEKLTIQCEESIPLEPVGHVTSIVDCLVVIQSDSGVALDFDSVLFDESRNSIGVVYDLFGPVRSPFYSVRFNSKEEAAKIGVGTQIYYAPTAEQYTKKVIETQVKNEVPSDDAISGEEIVFSDDEKEKEYLKRKAARKHNAPKAQTESQPRGQKRHMQVSEPTAQREGGAERVAARAGSWDWHNRNGSQISRGGPYSSRGRRGVRWASKRGSGSEQSNPYAEFGCYGPTPFVDLRHLQ